MEIAPGVENWAADQQVLGLTQRTLNRLRELVRLAVLTGEELTIDLLKRLALNRLARSG